MTLPTVTIYTDGGCLPNPGRGGWGAVLLYPSETRELSGAEHVSTNNRMELRAAVEALRALDTPHQVEFYTDSKYLKQGITEWLTKWIAKDWQTLGKTEVKNKDLWQSLAVQNRRHTVNWRWTKGHAGNKWNEKAHQLASAQIPKIKLPLDDQNAVHLFTSIAFNGKTKAGGWGVVLKYRGHSKTASGRVDKTSSNRLHIQGALAGLKLLKKPLPVNIYTTSDYLQNGATIWRKNWALQNWQTKEGKPVSHKEVWQTLARHLDTYQTRWYVVDKTNLPDEMKQAKKLATEARG